MTAIRFSTDQLHDFETASQLEWLETNGLGGWAGSTLSGAHTRRYHGLLVAAAKPPVSRMVLLSKLDETIICGEERYQLGSNVYPGTIYPQGHSYLHTFERKLFPVFEYRISDITIRKTIAACHGENTTVILYQALSGPEKFHLELLPLIAGRDFHGLTHRNEAIQLQPEAKTGWFRLQAYPDVPALYIRIPGADFQENPDWYQNFQYRREQERGLDFQEDLFSPGHFTVSLSPGDRLGVIVSTTDPEGRDAFRLVDRERRRRNKLKKNAPADEEAARLLTLAADQFIVQRGNGLHSIIAGYPWFSDWGRDTMIAVPGLCLATGRYREARGILLTFAAAVDQGLIPNRFPDQGEEPEFNTVDATLWFFVAIYEYLDKTGDTELVLQLLPVLEEILDWHDRGTRYGIHTDDDGLLSAGEPGVQLTWMDAKVGEWVVTPRSGKAVEINALWFNALKITAHFLHLAQRDSEADQLDEKAASVHDRFLDIFFDSGVQYLCDTVDGEHKDKTLRPNQIIALSLPYPLLDPKKARKVIKALEPLITPMGMRTLAPADPDYHGRYEGDTTARDSAYHRGTVWPWLLGPLVKALLRYQGPAGKKKAAAILEGLTPHLSEAGLGSISEIFDGDPPHHPRGCIAQAWSVAALLQAYQELAMWGRNHASS